MDTIDDIRKMKFFFRHLAKNIIKSLLLHLHWFNFPNDIQEKSILIEDVRDKTYVIRYIGINIFFPGSCLFM